MILTKPLIIFDTETTGINKQEDRIVQLAGLKYTSLQEEPEIKNILINPGIPIMNSHIHGITDEMVKNQGIFANYATGIKTWFAGCDLCGFNSDFDILILEYELNRCGHSLGIDFNVIDVLKLYRVMFPNTLEAIHKRLFGFAITDAHTALADSIATKDVLVELLKEYSFTGSTEELDKDLQSKYKRADLAGLFRFSEQGALLYNFGSKRHRPVFVDTDEGYIKWFLNEPGFPTFSKMFLLNYKKIYSI